MTETVHARRQWIAFAGQGIGIVRFGTAMMVPPLAIDGDNDGRLQEVGNRLPVEDRTRRNTAANLEAGPGPEL